jgi:hypothetical protein
MAVDLGTVRATDLKDISSYHIANFSLCLRLMIDASRVHVQS